MELLGIMKIRSFFLRDQWSSDIIEMIESNNSDLGVIFFGWQFPQKNKSNVGVCAYLELNLRRVNIKNTSHW